MTPRIEKSVFIGYCRISFELRNEYLRLDSFANPLDYLVRVLTMQSLIQANFLFLNSDFDERDFIDNP